MITTKVFSAPKEGEVRSEDSLTVVDWPEEGALMACLADGSSESLLGGDWSQALANWFIKRKNHTPMDIADSVERLLETFDDWRFSLAQMFERIDENRRNGKVVAAYVQDIKMKTGSSSTLLAVKLVRQEGSGTRFILESFSIGDSCWFLVRDQTDVNGTSGVAKLAKAFPVEHSSELNSRPNLISSNASLNTGIDACLRTKRVELVAGDRLFIMTDALAKWFLRMSESGSSPWEVLLNFHGPEEFMLWLSELRRSRLIDNDDVTLVTISI